MRGTRVFVGHIYIYRYTHSNNSRCTTRYLKFTKVFFIILFTIVVKLRFNDWQTLARDRLNRTEGFLRLRKDTCSFQFRTNTFYLLFSRLVSCVIDRTWTLFANTRKNLTIGRSNCDFFPRSFYLSYRDTNPIMNIFDINCDIAQRRHNFSLERFRDVATATSILRVIVQRRSSRLFLIEKKKRRISNEIGNIRKHFSLRL